MTAMMAGVEQDWDTVLSSVDESDALGDPLVAHVLLSALIQTGRVDAAIKFLSNFVSLHERYSGMALSLARLLTQRGACDVGQPSA